jgi:hypothetical protein
MSKALPTGERKCGYAQSCSISTDWYLLSTVRVTFAIDAKDCDISVGGISTECDAYLERPTAATLAPERRRCMWAVTYILAVVRTNALNQMVTIQARPRTPPKRYLECNVSQEGSVRVQS